MIRALQLMMSLSLLVIIHEGGHFLFARLFKVRVTKFYLFFDPWFSLFKFKPKNSETEYGVGWLPLGGYVQIAGMVDETQEIGVATRPECRRRGFALDACAAAAKRHVANGKCPIWSAAWDNFASHRLAERVGFEKFADAVMLSLK